MKNAVFFLLFLVGMCLVEARLVRSWSYGDLAKESDVILIGRVDSPSWRTGKQTKQENGNYTFIYDEVCTGFTVAAVLKGEYTLAYFQLNHYAYPIDQKVIVNGFFFARFPEKGKFFLLFLKREDGVLHPVSGDWDAADSFVELPKDNFTHSKEAFERAKAAQAAKGAISADAP